MPFENIKMRIIGFYNKPSQRMKPEENETDLAVTLAGLLKISFKTLTDNAEVDAIFRSVLQGNCVFILKGDNGSLYAYQPSMNIARISDVKYSKSAITQVPLIYKGWFYPGEEIPLIKEKEKKDVDKKTHSKSRYTITTSGDDFLLTDINNKRTLPLDWDKNNYISISNLNKLISHRWSSLYEYQTSEDCDGCDGYDYSNCDMSRCKNDCEHCGGRKHICNNSCFNHRYASALRIWVDETEATNLIQPLLKKLKEANSPHCKQYKELFNEIEPKLEPLRFELSLFTDCWSSNFGGYNDLRDELYIYEKLAHARDKAKTETPFSLYGLKVSPSNVKFTRHGFLFWHKWHLESTGEAYDYNADRFVRFDLKLAALNESEVAQIQSYIYNGDSERLSSLLIRKALIIKRNISHYDLVPPIIKRQEIIE